MTLPFVTDEEILELLKQPKKVMEVACRLQTQPDRVRKILSEHKLEVLKARVEDHQQEPFQICYQLEIIERLQDVKKWHQNNYPGDTTNIDTSGEPEQR